MVENKQLIFKEYPVDVLTEGQHIVVLPSPTPFDPSAPPPEGGLTLKHLCHSFDPYLRGRLRRPELKSYSSAFPLGSAVVTNAIARVLQSSHPAFPAGAIVRGQLPVEQYSTLTSDSPFLAAVGGLQNVTDKNPAHLPWSWFLGVLGMPGHTAYGSLMEIGQPKAGETIFVSAASGAVGQLVCILAKRLGLKVVASVGSAEKVKYCKEQLGCDVTFNYRDVPTGQLSAYLASLLATNELQTTGPGSGIDIYYDNVGGEHLEAAILNMNIFSRIVACGSISQYNLKDSEKYGIKQMGQVVPRRITMRGFLVFDPFILKWGQEHFERCYEWLKNGEMAPPLEHVVDGIEEADKGLAGIFRGENFGKCVLKVADDDQDQGEDKATKTQ